MKAVVCTKLGEPNLLEIKEVDKPTIGKDEVLIKVEVAGVNFPDALLVQGKYQIVIDPYLQFSLHKNYILHCFKTIRWIYWITRRPN